MPLSDEECFRLIDSLGLSLMDAGYIEAATEIAAVQTLQVSFGDRGPYRRDLERVEESLDLEPVALQRDPTAQEQLSAAIRVVELMIIDPLTIHRDLQGRLQVIDPKVTEISIGPQGGAILINSATVGEASHALELWQEALTRIREALTN
jgi:hypothetical protein